MGSNYANKVAVVTGAGSGLGRALAVELAHRGCGIALVDVDEVSLEHVAGELSRAGTRVTCHCADVGSEVAVQRVAEAVVKEHGQVDLLINNAGISISALFEETGAEAFERVLRVNFLGVVYGCRAFLPALRLQPRAQIVNVASSFAWAGYPGKTAYAASKGAVRAFTESLRHECAGMNIGVTLLYPGVLDTNIVRRGIAGSEEQREREMAFLKARGIAVERVARKAVDAMGGNPCRIVVGMDYRVLDVVVRVSPGLAGRVMGVVARRAGF